MTSNTKDKIYLDLLNSEVNHLKSLKDNELIKLPEYAALQKDPDGLDVLVSIYHKKYEGFDAFIVQSKRNIFLGYGHMFVDGLILCSDGRRDSLPDYVVWEYA